MVSNEIWETRYHENISISHKTDIAVRFTKSCYVLNKIEFYILIYTPFSILFHIRLGRSVDGGGSRYRRGTLRGRRMSRMDFFRLIIMIKM